MQPIYFAHGCREREAPFAGFFGKLLRKEELLPSLDPPSKGVNAAKLERHLRYTKALVAVVANRNGVISPHIKFEIAMAIRSGRPLLVFYEDTLSPDVLPPGIPKRRFSANSIFRETREHLHAIENLHGFIGREHIPKFVADDDRRSCLLLGLETLPKNYRQRVVSIVASRGYQPIEMDSGRLQLPVDGSIMAAVRSADLTISILDDRSPAAMYFLGVSRACIVPTLLFSTVRNFPLETAVPLEYQRQFIPKGDVEMGSETIEKSVDLFEQDFVEFEKDSQADAYARELANIADPIGEYSTQTRNTIIQELRMGDTYNTTGQSAAVGRNANASGNTFNQVWQQSGQSIDLGKLTTELETLRSAMRAEATSAEHDVAIGAIAAAQNSAEAQDGPGALAHLANAGKWALDVGTKIGTSVATAALKSALGI